MATVPEHGQFDYDPALRVTLMGALGRLSARDRTVLVLRYWEDRSIEETARMLGIRAVTVRARSRRALIRLRELFGDDIHTFTYQ